MAAVAATAAATIAHPNPVKNYVSLPIRNASTPAVEEETNPFPDPYYLSDGLRRVAPYHYTYNTFCKERWRGRGILDIFATEFRDRTPGYYEHAIQTGQIAINGEPCEDVRQVVKNGDVVSHTLHRHEPPVTAQPIRIIHETDTMMAIDKPAGVPVHPAGRYNYNSIVEIMRAERKSAFNPLPCNRLDRLTSGVMFIGKEKKEAERISEQLRSRTMRKEYIARVKGRFPDGEGPVDGHVGGVVTCDENILQISPILGLNRARASGKTAKTLFRRIAYYSPKVRSNFDRKRTAPNPSEKDQLPVERLSRKSIGTIDSAPPAAALPATESSDGFSIVHCLPLTGRTHQIRVHLQYLGHPITNDPIYANRNVFGSKLAIHDSSPAQDEEIKRRLARMGKSELADAIDYDQGGEHKDSRINELHAEIECDQPSYPQVSPLVDQTMQACASTLAKPVEDSTLSPAKDVNTTTTDISTNLPKNTSAPTQPSPLTSSSSPSSSSPSTFPFSDPAGYDSFVRQHKAMVSDYQKRRGERQTGEKCAVCGTDLYSDPGPHELGIYLHALAYCSPRPLVHKQQQKEEEEDGNRRHTETTTTTTTKHNHPPENDASDDKNTTKKWDWEEIRSEVPTWAVMPDDIVVVVGGGGSISTSTSTSTTTTAVDAEEEEEQQQQLLALASQTRRILARGWIYDGTEEAPVECPEQRQNLNHEGMRRNKK